MSMTFCVLNILEKLQDSGSKYAQLESQLRILRPVSQVNGTTANLIEGDSLTVLELMYGMMLPSGNDAAVALAIHFGAILMCNGTRDPQIVISNEAVERRLKAVKLVAAREEVERKRKIILQ